MLNCIPCPGHFADHPVEDIIEKIACQFTARHIRGRPRPPYWFLGFPLYVCDSRYNDRDRVFVKIKNWNSCIPEEVRKSTEFMPIYPFERTVYPIRYPSPFLIKGSKVKGPGGIIPSLEDIPNERKIMSARKVSGGMILGLVKAVYWTNYDDDEDDVSDDGAECSFRVYSTHTPAATAPNGCSVDSTTGS